MRSSEIQSFSDIKNPIHRLQAILAVGVTVLWIIPATAFFFEIINTLIANHLLDVRVLEIGTFCIISLIIWALAALSCFDIKYDWCLIDPNFRMFFLYLLVFFFIGYLLSFLALYLITWPLHVLYWLVYVIGMAFKEGSKASN